MAGERNRIRKKVWRRRPTMFLLVGGGRSGLLGFSRGSSQELGSGKARESDKRIEGMGESWWADDETCRIVRKSGTICARRSRPPASREAPRRQTNKVPRVTKFKNHSSQSRCARDLLYCDRVYPCGYQVRIPGLWDTRNMLRG